MEEIKNNITKATIKQDRLIVTYEENSGSDTNTVTKDCGAIIHADLMAAFNRLKVHVVVLCEQPEGSFVNYDNISDFDMERVSNYLISGFTKSGSDDQEGVCIIGQKLLKSGKALNITTPFTKYEDDYPYTSELGEDVASCIYEVEQYLFHGKCGVKQEKINFDNPEEVDIQMSMAAESVGTMTIKHRSSKKHKELISEAV